MFGLTITINDELKRIEKAERRAKYLAIRKTAFSIFETARKSFKESPDPSAPGEVPHTRRGGKVSKKTGKTSYSKSSLPGAIRYFADKEGAVIGPTFSAAGTVGMAHEFGGKYKDETFEERPFMSPALTENLDKFAGQFAGSISN